MCCAINWWFLQLTVQFTEVSVLLWNVLEINFLQSTILAREENVLFALSFEKDVLAQLLSQAYQAVLVQAIPWAFQEGVDRTRWGWTAVTIVE